MNETLKVLETRRSCRNFKPDMISKENLDAILRAGTYAATGMASRARSSSLSQIRRFAMNFRS